MKVEGSSSVFVRAEGVPVHFRRADNRPRAHSRSCRTCGIGSYRRCRLCKEVIVNRTSLSRISTAQVFRVGSSAQVLSSLAPHRSFGL